MRLVFLYGPPGAGKLSVAREVVALTGFKLFHNHLTIDLVTSVFPRGTPAFGRLLPRFRREMIAEAAREGVDLVFTYVYAYPDDDPDVRAMIEPVLAGGGAVCFVQLSCPADVLLTRVQHESRRTYGKLTDPNTLRGLLNRYDLFTSVPFGDSLPIDTGQVQPSDAARLIVTHYALPTAAQ